MHALRRLIKLNISLWFSPITVFLDFIRPNPVKASAGKSNKVVAVDFC